MRNIATALLAVTALHAEITINDIDKLVTDIKEERVGLRIDEIQNAKDPFIYPRGKFVKPVQNVQTGKKRYRFVLTAIINDRVKINNRWYGLNSKVNGYKITKVGENYAQLVYKNKQVRVFLKRPKSKKIKLLAK